MRKRLLVMLGLGLAIGCIAASVAAAEAPTFTLMVYLCGSDLESDGGSATDDLLEMITPEMGLDSPVSVVVETGGAYEWWNNAMDPELTQRWLVADHDVYEVHSESRRDMGDPQTLSSFVFFCAENFPADRYGLILWNHGGGSTTGVCFDEYTDNYLTVEGIHEALQGARDVDSSFGLDFIGFDACLMASFEMASYVKDFADYMVASEELAPSYGFDYEALVSALVEDPGIDTLSLCRGIADSFMEANLAYDPDDYMTISVLDLSGMDALIDALDGLGGTLIDALDEGDLREISRNRQNMRSFGDYHDFGSDMVDLGQFIELFSARAEAGTLKQALEGVVAYNRYTEDQLDNISGMSILMPMSTREDFAEYGEHYDPLSRYPVFSEFIAGYTTMLNGSDYVFTGGTPQRVTGWGMLSSLGDHVTVTGPGFQQVVEQIDEEGPSEEPFDDDGMLSYALTLSDEDMGYLAYVEGNLMLDVSGAGREAYIDLGYLQHALIDWDNNTVYSLFDGTWPVLEGQLVYMLDQIVTERTRRSLIDVTVNGEEVYLLVTFNEAHPDGRVIGYTQGYADNGAAVRGYTRLAVGDIITPNYYLYTYDGGEENIESFQGKPIEYTGQPLSFGYESLVGEGQDYAYSFCLNDVFGEYQFSDFLFFSM